MSIPRKMIQDFYINGLRLRSYNQLEELTDKQILEKYPSDSDLNEVIHAILDYLDYDYLMRTKKKWYQFWK